MEKIIEFNLIENTTSNRDLFLYKDNCDKYDYIAAAASGVVGAMIDIFYVGSPNDSKLVNWTDSQTEKVVKKFAKISGWSPQAGNENNIKSAIGFLEKKYKVNYDQRTSVDVNNNFNLSMKNHHMKSLGHSPDIFGLFFSVLNQFTNTSTFISDGKLITVTTENFELQGSNFISKIFCGIANWFGHLMSDISGSSGSVGRGSGIVMPFYSFFGFCNFGKFNVGKDKQDLATIAERAFKEGYDFRFGIAQTIPVILTEIIIKLIWSLRRRFQYGMEIKDCVPTNNHDSLRIMLIVGFGTLSVIDGMDALIRSKGNFLKLFMRLNLIAWFKFIFLVMKEVFIRLDISLPMQRTLMAFKRINQELENYLVELQKIDIEAFEKELKNYKMLINNFDNISNEKEMNVILTEFVNNSGIKMPWKGDFNEFMLDKNNVLVFE